MHTRNVCIMLQQRVEIVKQAVLSFASESSNNAHVRALSPKVKRAYTEVTFIGFRELPFCRLAPRLEQLDVTASVVHGASSAAHSFDGLGLVVRIETQRPILSRCARFTPWRKGILLVCSTLISLGLALQQWDQPPWNLSLV